MEGVKFAKTKPFSPVITIEEETFELDDEFDTEIRLF